jgi:hypothetical protein
MLRRGRARSLIAAPENLPRRYPMPRPLNELEGGVNASMDWSLRRNTGLPLVQQRNAQLNFTVPPSILLRVATRSSHNCWLCRFMALVAFGDGTVIPSKSVAIGIAADMNPPPVPVGCAGYDPLRTATVQRSSPKASRTFCDVRERRDLRVARLSLLAISAFRGRAEGVGTTHDESVSAARRTKGRGKGRGGRRRLRDWLQSYPSTETCSRDAQAYRVLEL